MSSVYRRRGQDAGSVLSISSSDRYFDASVIGRW